MLLNYVANKHDINPKCIRIDNIVRQKT